MMLVCASSQTLFASELHVYTSLDPMEAKVYIDAYEKFSATKIRWVRMSTGEVLTRLRAEKNRPQASVWLGGPTIEYTLAANDRLLDRYQPQTFNDFPDYMRDSAWRWLGVSESFVGFAVNPKVLALQNATSPTSWNDLLKPEFHGAITMAYAYTSGTAYTIIASLAQLMGEERAFKYWQQLDLNIEHYNRSGPGCVTQVGLGETGVCIAFAHDIMTKGIDKGYPLIITYPEEGTGYEVSGIALVAGGPERQEAQRFIDWMFDHEAQQLVLKMHNNPVRKDLPGTHEMVGHEAKRMNFDLLQAARERKRLIEKWREATGQ